MAHGRENELQQKIRIALGAEPDLVLWRNHVGVASVNGRMQRFGLCKGSADLVGIGPGGRFFCLEIKTPKGRIDEDQYLFANLVKNRGGFHAFVRSIEEAVAALETARREHQCSMQNSNSTLPSSPALKQPEKAGRSTRSRKG